MYKPDVICADCKHCQQKEKKRLFRAPLTVYQCDVLALRRDQITGKPYGKLVDCNIVRDWPVLFHCNFEPVES